MSLASIPITNLTPTTKRVDKIEAEPIYYDQANKTIKIKLGNYLGTNVKGSSGTTYYNGTTYTDSENVRFEVNGIEYGSIIHNDTYSNNYNRIDLKKTVKQSSGAYWFVTGNNTLRFDAPLSTTIISMKFLKENNIVYLLIQNYIPDTFFDQIILDINFIRNDEIYQTMKSGLKEFIISGLASKASQTDLTTTNSKVTTLETINSFLVGKTKNIFLENNRVNIICGVYRDVESNFGYIPETNTLYPMYFEIINNRSFKLHRIHSWTIIFTFNKDVIINSQTINNQLYTILSFVYNRTSEFKNIEMNIEYVGNNAAQDDLDAQIMIHSIQLIFDTKASQADLTTTNTKVTALETLVETLDNAIFQMILATNIVANRNTLQNKINSGDIIFEKGTFLLRTGNEYNPNFQCLSGGNGNSNPPVICSNANGLGFGIVCNTNNFILKSVDAITLATVTYNMNIIGASVSIQTNPINNKRYVYLGIPYTYGLTMTWSAITSGLYVDTFNNVLKANLAAVFTQIG